jgi:hypothetical protein
LTHLKHFTFNRVDRIDVVQGLEILPHASGDQYSTRDILTLVDRLNDQVGAITDDIDDFLALYDIRIEPPRLQLQPVGELLPA